LIFGLVVFGLAGGAAAFGPTYEWVLVCRAIQGVGASALLPLTIVLISDVLPEEEEEELQGQGIKVALDRISMILLPLIGGALAILSWRAVFVPFFLILLLALAALLWMPETGRPRQDSLRPYLMRTSRALREPRFALAFATGFLRFFLDYGLYTYLPILVAFRYGATPVAVGVLITLSAVGSILTASSHPTHPRPRFDRKARGAGVLSQRDRARYPGAGRTIVAGRCRDVAVRAWQRSDFAVTEKPDDAAHTTGATRWCDCGRPCDPADCEIGGASVAWRNAAGCEPRNSVLDDVRDEHARHAGADRGCHHAWAQRTRLFDACLLRLTPDKP